MSCGDILVAQGFCMCTHGYTGRMAVQVECTIGTGGAGNPRRMALIVRRLAEAAGATVWFGVTLVAGASASSGQTGTLVVRVVTDPAPAGVSWTFSGAGAAFELGQTSTAHTVSLPAGPYQLKEAPTKADQANSLTALACTDPTSDTTTDVATTSVSVNLADGEAVTCTFTHRALGRRSAAATLALARTYAPVLRLNRGERYTPLRLEDYLSASSLHSGQPPQGPLLEQQPRLFSLPTNPGRYYLDLAGAEPNTNPAGYSRIQARLQEGRPRPTVYWHVARQPATGRIAIEYWLLYLYNDFYDRHEADWEGVTVFLHGTTPLGISYSAHQGRRWSSWAGQTTSGGTHSIVYVARGSHADYARAGNYSIRVCWTLYGRHCTPTPRVDTATGTGRQLAFSGYDLQEFGGTPYAGSWGSGTYILGIGRTQDQITDPRRRSDYSNPFTILNG
jgi:hypothetical protein